MDISVVERIFKSFINGLHIVFRPCCSITGRVATIAKFISLRVHVEGLEKNRRKFVWLGETMLYTNLVFQSFPTLHSARIASQIHFISIFIFCGLHKQPYKNDR